MARGGEVIGECVKGIMIDVDEKMVGLVFGVSWFFAVMRRVPRWVSCQAALMATVPGIGD